MNVKWQNFKACEYPSPLIQFLCKEEWQNIYFSDHFSILLVLLFGFQDNTLIISISLVNCPHKATYLRDSVHYHCLEKHQETKPLYSYPSLKSISLRFVFCLLLESNSCFHQEGFWRQFPVIWNFLITWSRLIMGEWHSHYPLTIYLTLQFSTWAVQT